MVLPIIKPKNNFQVFILTSLATSISLLISYFILPNNIGLATSFLITIALTYYILEVLKEKSFVDKKEKYISRKYAKVFDIYATIFLGIFITTLIVQHVVPNDVFNSLFSSQINEIKRIRGSFLAKDTFSKIFYNNLTVLSVIFLFSIIYGSASIFIIAWNATVLSTAITLGTKQIFYLIPFQLFIYLPHASLEFIAYFLTAIGGGIIAVSIGNKNFYNHFTDAFMLFTLSVAILFVAAFIEVLLML